jgi:B9 domain-containing protein 2
LDYFLGSTRDRLRQYIVGGGPQLTNPDLVSSTNDRYRLSTESMGTVYLELSVILRNFNQYGIEC